MIGVNWIRPEEIQPHRRRHEMHTKARIFKLLRSPGSRFQGTNAASIFSLAARYDKAIPTRILAPIAFSKIPAQVLLSLGWNSGGEAQLSWWVCR